LPPQLIRAARLAAIALVVLQATLSSCALLPSLPQVRGEPAGPQTSGLPSLLGERESAAVLALLEQSHATEPLPRYLALMGAVARTPLTVGNAAQLLVDGPATYSAMMAAIEAARDRVNLESYTIDGDALGERLAELLIAKRREGVQVNVIYDSIGSMNTPAEYFERLRAEGVSVCEFNPANPLRTKAPWRLNHRDHRKILVVDGRIAITGGVNISGVYSASSFGSKRRNKEPTAVWRDTDVELRGPVAADFEKAFFETWERQHCRAVAAAYQQPQPPQGNKAVWLIASGPDGNRSLMYVALLVAIAAAEKRVCLTMGYFVPDQQTLDVLKEAAGRGVDVRLVLPGFSDFWASFYAGRSRYAELLAAGVRIFERRDALLHAKTAVIDGVWSTVGSTNMDWRSFLHNDEANAVIIDREMGSKMERLFALDEQASVEIDAPRWAERSAADRIKELLARQWQYLL